MFKGRSTRNIARLLCLTMGVSAVAAPLVACGGGAKYDNESTPLVLATDVLDGVFNPFFYTSGSDGEVVSQTQIAMLASDEKGQTVANWEEPCVSLAYSTVTNGSLDEYNQTQDYKNYNTDYYFALKDGIKFSDGVELTANDVLFNIYMYLDPAYTGSSTMYSVAIKGLQQYRMQTDDENEGNASSAYFDSQTTARIDNIYQWATNRATGDWGEWDRYEPYEGEKTIESDILKAHELFREELESDWTNFEKLDVAKDYAKYVDANGNPLLTESWQIFLLSYRFLETKKVPQQEYYELIDNYGQSDHSKETLINYVYSSMVGEYSKATETYKKNLVSIISYYGTASTFRDYVRSKVIEHQVNADGGMKVKKISGIEIIKDQATIPTQSGAPQTLTDKDGNAHSYDVLHININGQDPKAIQNFGFTVAPGHYYGADWDRVNGTDYFGVKFASADFMTSVKNIQVPLGAGPYRASAENGSTVGKDQKTDFFKDNIVNFERNDNFLLGAPKIKKLRYKVVSNNTLYDAVKRGEVHYASPNMDYNTVQKLEGSDSGSLSYASADNLGYGYIGISARYVPNIWLRRAIMTTLNAQMCVNYYGGGQYASVIYRPMSQTLTDYYDRSWTAYSNAKDDFDYTYDSTGEKAKQYTQRAKNSGATDADLKLTFTIAGDSDDHPANQMLQNSVEILRKIGWDVTLTHDSTALSKLANGQLSVWAAAWSSSSDPDMYQVYHTASTATSTLAWGYPHLKSNQSTQYERSKLDELDGYIEDGRKYMTVAERKPYYERALNALMDLAVEFPTYQRKVYYVWGKNVFNESTMYTGNQVATYRSPLSEIWNVSFNESAD